MQIASFESESKSVPAEVQVMHFSTAVQEQEINSGVQPVYAGKITTRTQSFFLELSQPIGVQSKEEQLVNFLYNLGSGNSLIRARDLTLKPDQPHQQLVANVTLVANYQRKAPARGSAAPGAVKAASVPPRAASTPPRANSTPPGPGTAPSRTVPGP